MAGSSHLNSALAAGLGSARQRGIGTRVNGSRQDALPTLHNFGIDLIDIAEASITGQLAGGLPRNNVVVHIEYCSTPMKTTSFAHPVVGPVISLRGSLGRAGLGRTDIYPVQGLSHLQACH
ncbi:aldo/keto reductase [Colletotrichum graminicola]|uniref:Aldo/keto reductase n=1 Tax=Colletotrichum graminicola (strain M1.001 / M2 / FGSC 10212) TaxID=645133 RepID=E3QYS5_COLGM|nr:aldo/keto reductase [Colletotrichum graminicola M1.001]EFQ36013.1 aldo/keto reductase [Colletotrichum graminicola M1.001]WDK17140.1 aldo/keto reductase [Colletotrichum graminicola]